MTRPSPTPSSSLISRRMVLLVASMKFALAVTTSIGRMRVPRSLCARILVSEWLPSWLNCSSRIHQIAKKERAYKNGGWSVRYQLIASDCLYLSFDSAKVYKNLNVLSFQFYSYLFSRICNSINLNRTLQFFQSSAKVSISSHSSTAKNLSLTVSNPFFSHILP